MSIVSRLARGLRRAAPTGALTVLWAGLGAAGFTLFFGVRRALGRPGDSQPPPPTGLTGARPLS